MPARRNQRMKTRLRQLFPEAIPGNRRPTCFVNINSIVPGLCKGKIGHSDHNYQFQRPADKPARFARGFEIGKTSNSAVN
jgi:hypothetical protein